MFELLSFSAFLRATRSWVFFLLLLAFGVYSYFYIDQSLAVYMYGLLITHPERIGDAQLITQSGYGLYYFIALPVLYLFFRFILKSQRYSRICFFLFSALAITGVVGQIIKFLLGRYRPSAFLFHHQYGFHFFQLHSTEFSFPSGHSLVISSIMVGLSCVWRRWWGIFMLIAAAVSFSRVMVTAHYLTDVIAGMYLSILIVPWVYKKILQREQPVRK